MISDFCLETGENCALLGYYTVSSNFLLMFWDNLLAPSSRVKNKKRIGTSPLEIGTTGSPETSARNHHYWLRNKSEECISPISGSYRVSFFPLSLALHSALHTHQ